MSNMPNLLHKLENIWGETTLVRRSTARCIEGVNQKATTFLVHASLTNVIQTQCAWSFHGIQDSG